jgi:lipid-A-disaccharide synthase-like uncharacterized protein
MRAIIPAMSVYVNLIVGFFAFFYVVFSRQSVVFMCLPSGLFIKEKPRGSRLPRGLV